MGNRKFKILILILLFIQIGTSQNINFEDLRKDFIDGHIHLQQSDFHINYTQGLKMIKPPKEIRGQENFYKAFKEKLDDVSLTNLDDYEKLDYHLMQYEIALRLERISLEKQWDHNTNLDDSKSIHSIPNGKKWYAYLLKLWVDAKAKPEEMFRFGLAEIEIVKSNMKRLQESSGLSETEYHQYLDDETFFFDNPDDIQKAFEEIKLKVGVLANDLFPYVSDIPEVKIARGTNKELSHAPAYYSNNTFFYNVFDKPFNKRQLRWFYAHEAIPGHHYQSMVNSIVKRTEIQDLFWYPGYVEGWGAYVEYLGNELGIFETIYDEYGKWEWDLVRSVRVCMDVALNYYGWSDAKAMAFWKEHIKGQDDIALREINRMKRWPAQVITYKYGAKMFLELLESAKTKSDFDFKTFHQEVLKHGDVPVSVLRKSLSSVMR